MEDGERRSRSVGHSQQGAPARFLGGRGTGAVDRPAQEIRNNVNARLAQTLKESGGRPPRFGTFAIQTQACCRVPRPLEASRGTWKTHSSAPAGLRQAACQAESGAAGSPRFQLPAEDKAQAQARQCHRSRSLASVAAKVRGEVLHHLHLGFASILPERFDMPLVFNA